MLRRVPALLAALSIVGGLPLGIRSPAALADVAPAAPSIDPLAARARVDPLGAFRADATPTPPATSPAVPSPKSCTSDAQCEGRSYCDAGHCVEVEKRTWALVYFHKESKEGTSYRHVLPFYWHWWTKDHSVRIVLPFAAEARKGDHTVGAAPLLLTGWSSNRKTGDYRALVLGHSWFSRSGDESTAVVFPLVWHFSDATTDSTSIFPLVFIGHNRVGQTSRLTVFPFFHLQRDDKARQRLYLTPLGGYQVDDEQGTKQFIGVAPPYYHRSDPRRTVDVLFPLVLRWSDREDHTTTVVVGPFVRHSNPEGSTTSLLPLIWFFSDKASGASTLLVLPIFASHASPGLSVRVFGPFYDYQSSKGWSSGLFPVAMFQDLDGRSHQMVLPLFAHRRDERAGTDTTGVLNTYFHKSRDGWDGGFLPLLFGGRHGDVKYASVAGVYYYRGDRHGSTHVLGPIYARSTDRGYSVGLMPIAHFGSEDGARTSWLLPPLWLHTDDPKTHSQYTMIGPVFRAASDGQRTQGVFPLAWGIDRGPRHLDLVLPLFARYRDEERRSSALWIGPYVRLHDERRGTTTNLFVPLFARHDAPGYHVTVQFPFFWRVVEGDETDTVVFPLYGRVRRPGHATDVLFPLVWRFAWKDSSTLVVGPFFHHAQGGRSDGGLVPLFGWGGNESRRWAWALPLLLWHQHDAKAGTSLTIMGPFAWQRLADGWTNVLAPLYGAWRRGPTTRFLGPLIFHSDNRDEGTSFNLVGPFYTSSSPHQTDAGLVPLVFARKHDDGRWGAGVVPLFYAHRKSEGFTLLTPIIGFSTYPTGARGYVGLIYFRHDDDGYTAAFFPLFYQSRDRLANHFTSLLIPLYVHSTSPEGSLTAVTPLVWRSTSVESATTLALPLYFDHDTFHESRTTGVLPFYIRHHSNAESSTTHVVLPLLLYVRKAPEGHDVVVFPIVWSLVSKGEVASRTTVVAPIFWDFIRGESRTQVLFPFYMHASRPSADYTLVANFYYKRGRGPAEGSYYWNLFPLFDFARPRKGDVEWNILGGVVGYTRIGKNRTLKLFFGLEIPLSSPKVAMAPTGTFFTSTPAVRGGGLF